MADRPLYERPLAAFVRAVEVAAGTAWKEDASRRGPCDAFEATANGSAVVTLAGDDASITIPVKAGQVRNYRLSAVDSSTAVKLILLYQ